MRWRLVIPSVVVVALIVVLGYGLTREPSVLPSALIGQPVPEFSLPTLASERPRVTDAALKGQVSLVNFWASWCAACLAEHPYLMEISLRMGVPILGINYKDTRQDALQWLRRYGNPFAVVAFDPSGRVGFNFGVGAIPETFVVDATGTIRHKVVGPITPEIMNETLIPLLNRLRRDA